LIHTAELVVPANTFTVARTCTYGCAAATEVADVGGAANSSVKGGGAAAEEAEWRSALIEAEAAKGSNPEFSAWWVPDIGLGMCPLFAAVRATLVTEAELIAAAACGLLRVLWVQVFMLGKFEANMLVKRMHASHTSTPLRVLPLSVCIGSHH
jgi:hypothetical protein